LKNVKILTDNLETYSKKSPLEPIKSPRTKLSSWVKKKTIEIVWDGETTNGWRGAVVKMVFPDSGWKK